MGFAHDEYQHPKNLLLPSEGIFVTQSLAPPARGYKCAANTRAERKHEKLIKKLCLITMEFKILSPYSVLITQLCAGLKFGLKMAIFCLI